MESGKTHKTILHGLLASDYEYKGEKELQKTLNSNKVIEKLFAVISEYGAERMFLLQYIGSSIEVKESNLPDIYNILKDVCMILDVKNVPQMYIQQDPTVNACALGINNPVVVINTGSLDKLSMEELYFIIGHEVGHIKSKHTRYSFLHMILPFLGALIPAIGSLISLGIKVLLYRYNRMAEFTSDRAGLLCCQDINVATESLMKLAGYPEQYYNSINKEDFIKQFDDFKNYNENMYNKTLNLLASINMSHPWSVLRGKELYDWVNNKHFDNILDKAKQRKIASIPPPSFFCKNCGKESVAGKYCPYCGVEY
jgi:Zn-dependent protease with chaperone function